MTHRVVVAQSELLAALVHEIENEFLVLTVLAGEHILALEHGRIEA